MHADVKPDMPPVLKWIGDELQAKHVLVELRACLQVPDVNGNVIDLCGDLLSMHVAKTWRWSITAAEAPATPALPPTLRTARAAPDRATADPALRASSGAFSRESDS